MSGDPSARSMWRAYEPYHALTYFAPETNAAYQAAGLRGFWMGYFAGRAAPMGSVRAGVVTATFFNFAPSMVCRAIPDAWGFSSPERVLDARLAGTGAALERILGASISSRQMAEAASLAEEAIRGIPMAGRPIFAANAELAIPEEPHLRLWWAVTCLREHRGDGHVAALAAAGLDGCEAHVSFVATGAVARKVLQPNRGWTDDDWSAAAQRLQARGCLDHQGRLTPAGRALRQRVEDDTDRMAAEPWLRLGLDRTQRLLEILDPLSRLVRASGGVPTANPMGLPSP